MSSVPGCMFNDACVVHGLCLRETVFPPLARSLRPHVLSLQFPLPPIESVFLLCLTLFPSGRSFFFLLILSLVPFFRGLFAPHTDRPVPAPDWSPARKGVPQRALRERRNGAGSGRAESRAYLIAAPYYFFLKSVRESFLSGMKDFMFPL